MADGGDRLDSDALVLARQRLVDWLAGPALLEVGAGRLAVLARREDDGDAYLGYPEIAGYYLVFLAAGGLPPKDAAARATAIAAWLSDWLAAGGLTRPPSPGPAGMVAAAADWRNGQQFLFDDAMLLRGLQAAKETGLLTTSTVAPLAAALFGRLSGLLHRRAELRACRSCGGSRPPRRWSTRRGPFLLKAVAALRCSGELPAALAAAVDLLEHRLWPLPVDPHRDCPHAALYAFEGARLLGRALALPGVLTARQRQAPRLDQVAQWLRLRLLDGADPADPAVQQAVMRLLRTQRADGGLPFAEAPADTRANTWASLFAWQALDLHTRALAGRDPREALPWLI